jgi:hypothetical protein
MSTAETIAERPKHIIGHPHRRRDYTDAVKAFGYIDTSFDEDLAEMEFRERHGIQGFHIDRTSPLRIDREAEAMREEALKKLK